MNDDKKTRWRTALHEAAHIVVARQLNRWDTFCQAAVFDTGGGLATLPKGLTDHALAVATAAGTEGADLLAECYTVPTESDRPKRQGFEELRSTSQSAIVAADAEAGYKTACQSSNDAQMIARYCIDGREDDPKEWHEVYDRVHQQAAAAVARFADEIAAVARTLFYDGAIYFDGQDNDFFKALQSAELETKHEKQE